MKQYECTGGNDKRRMSSECELKTEVIFQRGIVWTQNDSSIGGKHDCVYKDVVLLNLFTTVINVESRWKIAFANILTEKEKAPNR